MNKYLSIIFGTISIGTTWFYGKFILEQIINTQKLLNNQERLLSKQQDLLVKQEKNQQELLSKQHELLSKREELLKQSFSTLEKNNSSEADDVTIDESDNSSSHDLSDHLSAIFQILVNEDKKEKALELFENWNKLFPEHKIE